MQAVLLAAGQSSRFVPFNETIAHKSLIPLLGKTLLEHTLISLKKHGITDVIIVVNHEQPFREALAHMTGMTITYVTLTEALGMGAALLQAKPYIRHSTFFLMNANHIDFDAFAAEMLQAQQTPDGLVLLGKEDEQYEKYGYMVVKEDKVVDVIEKPKIKIPESLRVIGIYLLTKTFITLLSQTPAGHYNFETALADFAKTKQVYFVKTDKETITLKYVWDLFAIKNYLLRRIIHFASPKAYISPHATLIGDVYIEEGARISEGAYIKGPCYIGKNAFVGTHALVRNETVIAERGVVGSFMEMKNVILMEHTTTHTGVIEDAIIGKNCKIAAGVLTANVRLDRRSILVTVKDEKVDTGLRSLGALIGDGVAFGIRVSTMPGVIIGSNTLIGPATTVMKNIPANTKYYTKFTDIIEEKITK